MNIKIIICLGIITLSWYICICILDKLFVKLYDYYNKNNQFLWKKTIESISKPIRVYLFAIIFFYIICNTLDIYMFKNVITFKIWKTITFVFISCIIHNVLTKFGENPTELKKHFNTNIENILFPFFIRVWKTCVVLITVVFICKEWGYDINGFVTGLGVAGVAFSLGAKDLLSNIFGGIAIVLDKSFGIGDRISTNTGDIEGVVEDINFRSTKIRTFDKAIVSVPNAFLANQSIYNWTRRNMRRVKFYVSIKHNTPIPKMTRFMKNIKNEILNHKGIDNNVYVAFEQINSDSIDILVQYLTKTPDFDEFIKIRQDVNIAIINNLRKENIKIAHKSNDIYMN